jgi:HupE / UreJ protein
MNMLRALILAGLAFAAVAALPAQAHNAGVSTSRLAIRGRTVNVEINALGLDYEKAAGVRLIEAGSGVVNAVALAVMAPSVLSYVGDHVAVLAGGQPCSRTAATARPADTHVLVTIAWTCPFGGSDLRYHVTLFQDVDPAARHVAVISTEHGEREFVLDRTAPAIDLSGAGSSTLQLVGRFIRAGIEHIFLGYDHIAFLLAVILWGRSLWPLVKVVTAFTSPTRSPSALPCSISYGCRRQSSNH